MCGLVCVIPKSSTRGFLRPELDMFETLVTIDTLRGKDSTGVFGYNGDELYLAKDTLTGSEFLKTKEYKDIDSKSFKNGKFLVAHNRAATRGTVNDRNAHPFHKDDKIVMVHNGTFTGDHKKHADTEVDSEAICHLLAEHEVNEVDTVLNKITAAYALIWFDARDKSLNIVRNSQRPLFMLETNTCYVFSSEYMMLQFAAFRTNISMAKDTKPEEVPEHTHLKITMDNSVVIKQNQLNVLELDWDDYRNYMGGHQYHHKHAVAYHSTPPQQQQKPTVVDMTKITKSVIDKTASTNSSSFRGSIVDIADKDFVAAGHAMSYIQYDEFSSYREQYKEGSEAYFSIDYVVPSDDKTAVIYGRCTLDNGVMVVAKITEDDFTKLVDIKKKKVFAKGKVDVVTFKNKTPHVDHSKWAGPVFVTVKDISALETTVHDC